MLPKDERSHEENVRKVGGERRSPTEFRFSARRLEESRARPPTVADSSDTCRLETMGNNQLAQDSTVFVSPIALITSP